MTLQRTNSMGDKKREEGGKRSQAGSKFSGDSPRVSFIVAVYNSATTLEMTLLSIINQAYGDLELIVIDGGSTDGSLDIIKKYDSLIDYWISEPDRGIADAFNKGVHAASGMYINFQGAGDVMESSNVLAETFSKLNGEPLLVSGRIRRVDEQDIDKTLWISPQPLSGKFDPRSLLFKMSLYHQGLFTHRSFFDQYGLFDESLKFSMDYEHLLRAYHQFPQVQLVNAIISRWRADGVGQNRDLEIFKEYDLIKRRNHVAAPAVLTLVNLWTLCKYRLKQLIK